MAFSQRSSGHGPPKAPRHAMMAGALDSLMADIEKLMIHHKEKLGGTPGIKPGPTAPKSKGVAQAAPEPPTEGMEPGESAEPQQEPDTRKPVDPGLKRMMGLLSGGKAK